jgi:hypothetical protein
MADKEPPEDDGGYPQKPDGDATALEIMQYMERVDHFWQRKGFEKIESDDTADSE